VVRAHAGLEDRRASTPADAKGLMAAAIREPNPVIFLESKGLYGFFRTDLREDVRWAPTSRFRSARRRSAAKGKHVSVLTYGAMTWTALQAAEELAREGIELEVLDLRSLVPLDEEAIAATAKKTGRVIVLHEDTRRGGLGGELAALLSDDLFWYLDARCAASPRRTRRCPISRRSSTTSCPRRRTSSPRRGISRAEVSLGRRPAASRIGAVPSRLPVP
jgi:pyruvate/2-oxoglutarate/acetoin dehydrogenase E1 component